MAENPNLLSPLSELPHNWSHLPLEALPVPLDAHKVLKASNAQPRMFMNLDRLDLSKDSAFMSVLVCMFLENRHGQAEAVLPEFENSGRGMQPYSPKSGCPSAHCPCLHLPQRAQRCLGCHPFACNPQAPDQAPCQRTVLDVVCIWVILHAIIRNRWSPDMYIQAIDQLLHQRCRMDLQDLD